MRTGKRVAAIDCGTNAIRLLIAENAREHAVPVDLVREMRTVRLGEGVDATGEFSSDALARTFQACGEYAELIREHQVEQLRFIATSASRDVSNRDEFIHGVEAIIGVQPEVISGDEEARLSFVGATSGFDPLPNAPILVADIGGGSTEFVMPDSQGKLIARSINVGCVRMTERYLLSDPPTLNEIERTVDTLNRELLAVKEVLPTDTAQTFIGLAGSVTTIAAMALGLDSYDADAIHGTTLSRDQVEVITEQLVAMSRADRARLGFMHPGRVDVIGGGALVLREAMRALDLERVLVSEHDLLDGVVLHLTRES